MLTKRNGVVVEELTEQHESYKIWIADLMECPECFATVVVRFGRAPLHQHFEEDYKKHRAKAISRGKYPDSPVFLPFYEGRCRPRLVPAGVTDPRD